MVNNKSNNKAFMDLILKSTVYNIHNLFYMYTLLYVEWMADKDLLYSTGNSAQYYIAT